MKAKHLKTGRKGEKMALAEIRRLGMEFITKNFSLHQQGEIDIIARDGGILCFIEVKTRHRGSTETPFTPADAVTSKKREHLRKAAAAFRKKHSLQHLPWRYDIVEVLLGKFFWQHQTKLHCDVFTDRKH